MLLAQFEQKVKNIKNTNTLEDMYLIYTKLAYMFFKHNYVEEAAEFISTAQIIKIELNTRKQSLK